MSNTRFFVEFKAKKPGGCDSWLIVTSYRGKRLVVDSQTQESAAVRDAEWLNSFSSHKEAMQALHERFFPAAVREINRKLMRALVSGGAA